MQDTIITTIKALQPLVDRVPPPSEPFVQLHGVKDWNRVFAFYGTRLPEDFVQFHRLYGQGYFYSHSHKMSANLSVFPHAGTNPSGIGNGCGDAIALLHEMRLLKEKHPKRVPFELYFNPGGLLPWARTTNDTLLCWKVSGTNPDVWPIVAVRTAKGQYEEHGKGMGRFLAGVISGGIQSELMPNGFPGNKGVSWERSRI